MSVSKRGGCEHSPKVRTLTLCPLCRTLKLYPGDELGCG
jgi:hypothetical protein